MDWADRIAEARRADTDLRLTMSEADWSEYRAECRSWLGTEAGEDHKQRALDRIATKRVIASRAN